jgi:hypothetical protein
MTFQPSHLITAVGPWFQLFRAELVRLGSSGGTPTAEVLAAGLVMCKNVTIRLRTHGTSELAQL